MMYFWFLLFVSLVLAANNEKLTRNSKVVLDARDFINEFYQRKGDSAQRTVVSVGETAKVKTGENLSYELVLKLDNKIRNEVCRLKVVERGGKYTFSHKPECE